MDKMFDLDLVYLEMAITELDMDTEYVEDGLYDGIQKLADTIQEIISYMIEYVKNLKTDIKAMASKTVMKAKLVSLKQKAAEGAKVAIPDFKKIETVYGNACKVLPKQLKKLLKDAYPIKSSSDLMNFQAKKQKFEQDLIKLEASIEEVISAPKVYSAKDAYDIIDRLLHEDSIYIDSYYKIIREFEYFKAEYERSIKLISGKNEGLSRQGLTMHKSLIAKTSTTMSRLLKKSVFAIALVV